MKKLGTFVIALILLSSFALADFSFETQGSSTLELCPRDTGLFVNVVKNLGAAAEFTFSSQGSAASWSTTVPNGAVLDAAGQKTIYTYITPTQNAVPADYSLDVVASGDAGTKSRTVTIKVKDCFNAALVSSESTKTVCPAEVTKFEATLQNTGAYREDFILRVDGQLKDKVSVSEDVVSLAAGERKKVYAYVTAPRDAAEYGFSIVAQGSSGRSVQSLSNVLIVQECYDFRVNIEKNAAEFCENTNNELEVEVKNAGTTTNTYGLSLSGPEWVVLENEQVTLLPGASADLTLHLQPPFGVEGEKKVELTVTPERGERKAIAQVNVNVKKCHGVNVEVVEKEATLCNNGNERTFEGFVKNTGESQKGFTSEVKGPAWITVDLPKSFSLNANEEKKFTIKALARQDVAKGKYDVVINVNATDSSAVTTFDSTVLVLSTLSTQECYKAVLDTKYKDLVIYVDSSVTVPITIRNEGAENAEYEVVLSGSATGFARVTPAIVSVAPGRAETVYLYIAPGAQTRVASYSLEVGVKLKDSAMLASLPLKVRLTDVKEEATLLENISIAPIPNSSVGLWQRFKGWVKRTFAPSPVANITTNESMNGTTVNATVVKTETVSGTKVINESVKTQTPAVQVPVNGTTTAEVKGEEKQLETVSGSTSGVSKWVNQYRYGLLGLVVIILVLIILWRINAFGKAKESFNEEDDDDDE